MSRPLVALGTIALHGAVLAWLLFFMPRSITPTSEQASVSVRLLPGAQSAQEQPRLRAEAPRPPAFSAIPLLTIAAPAAGPQVETPAPATVAATPDVATQAAPIVTAAARPTEPEFHAAQAPTRQCTEQTVARHYPPMLRERGIEGQVLLRVRVDEQGRAAEVRVLGGSGWRLLDQAAQRITQDCHFVPARRGEQVLMSWVEYPVRFALN